MVSTLSPSAILSHETSGNFRKLHARMHMRKTASFCACAKRTGALKVMEHVAKLKDELHRCTKERKAAVLLCPFFYLVCDIIFRVLNRNKLIQTTSHMREMVSDLEEHLKKESVPSKDYNKKIF